MPVLNQGYPHFRDEEHTKITHGQPRISKALRFSARFLNFFFTRPELPRPLFPGPGLLRDSRRRTRYALRAAQWQSGECCKTRVRRYPKPPVAATNRSSRIATQAAISCCPAICAEFFPLLQCCEKREHSSVCRYRSGQLVKLRRVLNRPPPLYVRIRREFEYSFNAHVRKTHVRFNHRLSLLL